MRQMSFMLTTQQCREESKTVTRRLGWRHAKPGDLIQQIEQGQGLKKGETVRKIHVIRVVSVRREPLRRISASDVVKEGFPDLTPAEFIAMFCAHHRVRPSTVVTRIAFRYVHSGYEIEGPQ
jgi:hypothetical protein